MGEEMNSDQGRTYFVGTGPGEAGLITVKGLALVREAEVIVGDALGHAKLLQEARTEVEMHDVGNRAARNKVPQEQVNRLLLDLAARSKHDAPAESAETGAGAPGGESVADRQVQCTPEPESAQVAEA